MNDHVPIPRLATGVPGLDEILGGGVPELSFNLIAGPPGAGKTTLAHQIMFGLATPARPALFFTALGEPPMKMLRYQQQYSFFAPDKVGSCIRFVNLGDDLAANDYAGLLVRITREIETNSPGLVFVDSFRSLMLELEHCDQSAASRQQFVQQLGVQLSSWQVTTFLVGEYVSDRVPPPIFTVADGHFSLFQSVERNSMVRKIQIMKMRGQATSPGIHTFRITNHGIEVFPSATVRGDGGAGGDIHPPSCGAHRLTMGVPGLDAMMGGGLPSGYSLLVAGPSGSGKTILATAFLEEGVSRGEPGVLVAFEQTPSRSRVRTIDNLVRAGALGLINTRSLDLSMDEIVQHLTRLVHQMKAVRVVIDSLSGFELSLAPTFRQDFRESLFRMVSVLSGLGVTVLLTSELEDRYVDLRFSPYGSAFLTDAILVQRYIEVDSRLKRVLSVIKVRGSAHSKEICQFDVTDHGIVIGERVVGFEGLLAGRPARATPAKERA